MVLSIRTVFTGLTVRLLCVTFFYRDYFLCVCTLFLELLFQRISSVLQFLFCTTIAIYALREHIMLCLESRDANITEN